MSVLETPIILKLAPELAGILLSPAEFDAVEDHRPLSATHDRGTGWG